MFGLVSARSAPAGRQERASCGVHLPLNNHREREGECRALARLRLHPNPSAVHLNDALGYGKPQASATLFAGDRIVGLLKLLKKLGLIGRGDAGTSITDRYVE